MSAWIYYSQEPQHSLNKTIANKSLDNVLEFKYVGIRIRNENEVHGEDYCIQGCDAV
jgi:hypothetical protein